MSFRNLGAITNKAKLQAERERGYTNDEEAKSSESRAFKMFSEGKSPVEVALGQFYWTLQLTAYGQYIGTN